MQFHSSSLSSMASSSMSIGASSSSSLSSLNLLSPVVAAAGLAAREAPTVAGGASEREACEGFEAAVVVPGGPENMEGCVEAACVWPAVESGCLYVPSSFARVSDLVTA